MGKRKERRLAAKIAANRRVKLDIFADPSGDTVGTCAHEVGGDTEQEHRAVVPTSPSSSGQGEENPLLLLGQYSDDELEEEASKRPKVDADESSSDVADLDAEVEPIEDCGGTEKDIDGDKQQLEQADAIKNLDGCDGKEDESTYGTTECGETDPLTQVNEPEPSGVLVNGDLTGGWKVVMHEESNRYYYWNTVTGETSWEVPAALAGRTASACEGNVSHIDSQLITESAMDAYASDALGGGHLSSAEALRCNNALEIKNETAEVAFVGYDANHVLTHYRDSAASVSYANPSTLSDFGSSLQANAVSVGQLTVPVAEEHVSNDEDKDKHLKDSTECYGTADVHSSHLVKWCENLLQRLEALDRSSSRLEGHEWIKKEIEIRHSDCSTLSSYGSSLLPFWWHTEEQLKQLESAVSKGEASLTAPDKHSDKMEASQNLPLREECSLQRIEQGSEMMPNEKGISSSVKISCSSPIPEASLLQMEGTSQIPDVETVKTDGLSACHQHLGSQPEQESFQEAKPDTISVHLLPEGDSHANEDIDMDVEMEVDEEPGNPCTADSLSTLEQLGHSNQPPTEYSSLPSDEPCIPPPPDEEWIPPPPPDDEPLPPPPPEEPPLPLLPPSHPDIVSCPPYPDQYNIGYTAPPYEYYSSSEGITAGNYYAQAEGSQISEPQQPPYYDPVVTNALHEVAVDVNPVEAVAYYNVSSGIIPSVPVVSSVVSSGCYVEVGPFSYLGSVLTSDHTGSVGYAMETGNNISLLPQVNLEVTASSTVSMPQAGTLQASFVASNTQYGGSAFSNGDAVDPLPVASSNNQTKAVRKKKHIVAVAPSLRSNKKVSSLVDKWKAAKEELHSEEDEEPESALELIEKKRQKEIEEWRARQIASGEAQDNANFIPLGGDWRERVKRKRAKAKTEVVETAIDAVDKENQQPDLVELSKDLPSGWQAYWDESSKGVYYGNNITSETTWTRPTR